MTPPAPNPDDALLSPRFMRLLSQLAVHVQGRVRGRRRGERRARRRGAGGQFIDVRPYTVGDDLRHLDWHLYARLDTLLVRLYEAHQEHTVHVLLDTSASMGAEASKGRFALELAAALGYLALVSSDRAGIFALTEQIEARLGPLRGKNTTHKLLSFVGARSFAGQTNLPQAVRGFSASHRRGTAILISDFLTPTGRVEALRVLAQTGMRVAVLHTLSPEERRPTLGQDRTFVDSETGQELIISVDRRVRQAYLAQLSGLEEELRQTCRSYGFAFIPVDTGVALEDLILGPLREHGLVTG